MDKRLKDATEAIKREKALKAVAEATAAEKEEAAVASERKAIDAEKARRNAEGKLSFLETKLAETELRLAKADSLNLTNADQITDLKESQETCEDKWYNVGFSEAEKFVELIVHQARCHGLGEGWFTALKVMKVLEDSSLWTPAQIPYPAPLPIQIQADATNEEDTLSMRDLVREIDAHADAAVVEVTRNIRLEAKTAQD